MHTPIRLHGSIHTNTHIGTIVHSGFSLSLFLNAHIRLYSFHFGIYQPVLHSAQILPVVRELLNSTIRNS